MSNDSFCILPFIHLYSEPKGEVKPCCIASGFDTPINLKTMSIEEAFNSDGMKELRKDMVDGKRNKVCDVCYKQEDTTDYSPRLDFNKNTLWKLPEINEDYSVEPQFQHIDVRFSNLCNFKCRMCNHEFSSHWYDDYMKIKPLEVDGKEKVMKISDTISDELTNHLNNLKSIYFAGGEPLIMPEHYKILTHLYENRIVDETSKRRKISIHYNTNLSVLKFEEKSLVNMWEGFERVFLSISCDGIGKVGEYQRTGFTHDKFIENLKTVGKYFTPSTSYDFRNGMYYNFQYTTTIWNVYHIFDFIKFMQENKYITTTDSIDFYYSWQPNYSSLNNITQSEKDRLIQFLTDGMNEIELTDKTKAELHRIIDFIKLPPNGELSEVLDYTSTLDKLYHTNVMDLGGVDFNSMKLEVK